MRRRMGMMIALRPEKIAEFGESSLKTGLSHDRFHFSANTFHLAPAEFMDFAWA